MKQLQRITTEYVEAEDRIRLSGEGEEGQTLVLWFTQRLLSHLISHLIGLIEQPAPSLSDDSQPHAPASSLMQGFAQQAAQSELPPEPPVRTETASELWLVQEVDIAPASEGALVLIFKRERDSAKQISDEGKAARSREAKQLRQWLGIVHAQWRIAGWPLTLWPTWMDEQVPTDAGNELH